MIPTTPWPRGWCSGMRGQPPDHRLRPAHHAVRIPRAQPAGAGRADGLRRGVERVTKGQAASEVARLYTRARELCEQVGELSQLFRVLRGFCHVHGLRGAYQTRSVLYDYTGTYQLALLLDLEKSKRPASSSALLAPVAEQAAIDLEIRAVDITGGFRGEKHAGPGNLSPRAEAFEGGCMHGTLLEGSRRP
jgi:hypothetical protein